MFMKLSCDSSDNHKLPLFTAIFILLIEIPVLGSRYITYKIKNKKTTAGVVPLLSKGATRIVRNVVVPLISQPLT